MTGFSIKKAARGAALTLALLAASIGFGDVAHAASLERDIDTILHEEGLTGAVWALVEPGSVTTASAGYANMADGTPLAPGSRVHIGSVTKTLLATGVLRLATEGRIDLDAPVARYMPNIRFDNPWSHETKVTVRHLLDHTSGIEDARLWQMFSLEVTPDTPLFSAFERSPEVLKVRFRPGTQLSYSNAGYALLGLLVETVTGERYETYLDSHFLRPLGMKDSTFGYTAQYGGLGDIALAWGHYDEGKPAAAQPIMFRPAGQFTTTAADMATFAEFLMSDGRLGDEAFIAPEYMQARGIPHATNARWAGLAAGYGLGMNTHDRFGAVGKCHSGNVLGYRALFCVYPDENKAFFVSVNTDSETADYNRLFARVAAELNLKAATPPESDLPAADVSDWEGLYTLAPGRFEAFRYTDILTEFVEAKWQNGALVITTAHGKTRTLRPVGDYLLSADDRTLASHVLLRDDEDHPMISDGFRTYKKSSPAMVYGLRASLALGGAGLLWFLIWGVVTLIRFGKAGFTRPEGIALMGILSLLVPVPFYLTQSFMALGDMTAASISLCAASIILPLSMLVAHTKVVQIKGRSKIETGHGFATIAVVQASLILWYFDLLPLMLWR